MKVSLSSQIAWLESQVAHMEHTLVWSVKEGHLSVTAANAKMNAAKAALATLVQISEITKPKEYVHG